MSKAVTVRSRFWGKVHKTKGCWFWTAAVDSEGYGRIQIKNVFCLSHRVSWELYNGPIKSGLHILHSCDTRNCVNPDHLMAGTNSDNVKDKMKKGRHANGHLLGTTNPMHKLTESQVRQIRSLYSGRNGQQASLAKRFGVAPQTISRIILKQLWRHI